MSDDLSEMFYSFSNDDLKEVESFCFWWKGVCSLATHIYFWHSCHWSTKFARIWGEIEWLWVFQEGGQVDLRCVSRSNFQLQAILGGSYCYCHYAFPGKNPGVLKRSGKQPTASWLFFDAPETNSNKKPIDLEEKKSGKQRYLLVGSIPLQKHFLSQLVFQGQAKFWGIPKKNRWFYTEAKKEGQFGRTKKLGYYRNVFLFLQFFGSAIIHFSVIASVLGLGRDTLLSLSFRPLPTLLLFSNNTGYAGDMHALESNLRR